jgi:hypothetical protein
MIDELLMIPIVLSCIAGLVAGIALIYLALKPEKKDE